LIPSSSEYHFRKPFLNSWRYQSIWLITEKYPSKNTCE